ncbi:PTS sugar transporter subunit IIA [Thiobacillus sp.]|uniref:PTS sugar transporter subunit IIA n=1 Tax=Thiobacillus sp. TaxID=924 RepID=UPI00286E693C|nr:PTS sugar transporter subunit IIA [Thiobacillus sp.]
MNLNPLAVVRPKLFNNTRKPCKPGSLASHLYPENICLDVAVSNKLELFDVIGRHMEREHGLPGEWAVRSLSRREQAASTGLGKGVAIPHARVKDLERMQVAYLRLQSPIPFDAPDGNPVGDILVLLAPSQADEAHLRILADATQLFSDRRFRLRLHRCSHAQEVKHLFDAWSQPAAAFFSYV